MNRTPVPSHQSHLLKTVYGYLLFLSYEQLIMEDQKSNFEFKTNIPAQNESKARDPGEDEPLQLTPFDDENEHGVINVDDPENITYWANQFQISEDELKKAMARNGNSIKEIKKYLSI
jgi:hypothetical protein